MAAFVLTTFGQRAVTAAQEGTTVIHITDAKTADSTEFTSDFYYDFVSKVQTVQPSSMSFDKTGTGTALITVAFSNSSVVRAYDIVAVGLYAYCTGVFSQGTANKPKLFGYCILDNPDSMPLPTVDTISYTYQINAKVSNTDAITIELTDVAYASASDFMELTNVVHTNEANAITVRLNNTAESTERPGYKWLQEVSIQGMTEDFKALAEVKSGTYNGSFRVETAENKLRLFFVNKPGTSVYLDVIYFPTYR